MTANQKLQMKLVKHFLFPIIKLRMKTLRGEIQPRISEETFLNISAELEAWQKIRTKLKAAI